MNAWVRTFPSGERWNAPLIKRGDRQRREEGRSISVESSRALSGNLSFGHERFLSLLSCIL